MITGSAKTLRIVHGQVGYASDFGPFDGRTWLNTAHQGAMPRVAVEAARTAVEQKCRPYLIRNEAFFEVPVRLRAALGRLIGANPDDVILANSSTYGLDLLANAMPWRSGDEVLLVEGDYPSNVYPWVILRDQGVTMRFVKAPVEGLEPRTLAREISPRTRLFCASWVNPFTGYAIDVAGLGRVCRDRRVLFALNASQALGARVLDVRASAVDAVTCNGSKWLCGPYGTGFCWLTPELRDSLLPRHAYWLAMVAGKPLDQIRDYAPRTDLGARAWDVFGTANFLNFIPWIASLEYLLQAGPAAVAGYDDHLVAHLLQRVDDRRFEVVSPVKAPQRSTIVILRLKKAGDVFAWFERLTAMGLDIAVGVDSIRISPHLHNTSEDVDRIVRALSA
jgi:cysteine desulfurase / selenocysteine lyase